MTAEEFLRKQRNKRERISHALTMTLNGLLRLSESPSTFPSPVPVALQKHKVGRYSLLRPDFFQLHRPPFLPGQRLRI